MKLGIVGCGMIVHDLMRFIHEVNGVELEAIASIPQEFDKVKELAQENKIKNAYECYDDLLNDDNVEVVYLGVPNHLHYVMTKQALECGKNVICEKPFTSNYKELKELSILAKEKNLIIIEAMSTQYLPNVLKIKEKLPELGNIKIVSANYSQYSSRYDAFKEGIIQPAFDYTKSGGALMDLNIYNINLMVALFGAPNKVGYQANIEKGIDTSGILTLDYGTFKCVCIAAKDCKAPIMSTIQGDQGCVVIESPANFLNGFKVMMNKVKEKTMENKGAELEDYNNGKHRMYHEFTKFVDVFDNKDTEFANKMLDISLITMDIQTKARKDAGIVFTADK